MKIGNIALAAKWNKIIWSTKIKTKKKINLNRKINRKTENIQIKANSKHYKYNIWEYKYKNNTQLYMITISFHV